jgi:hypothetical protein
MVKTHVPFRVSTYLPVSETVLQGNWRLLQIRLKGALEVHVMVVRYGGVFVSPATFLMALEVVVDDG